MNTIKCVLVVSIVLVVADLGYHQVVNGQFIPCLVHSDSNLVIISLACNNPNDEIVKYASQGYEVKTAVNGMMYMQKVIPIK